VGTRLRKVFDPDYGYDAIVLARAGLERLGRLDVITEELSLDVMLPAPGQGALAVQCRDDPAMITFLRPIHHAGTALATAAERSFLAALGAGCSAPVAALAWMVRSELWLHGRVLAHDGSNHVDIHVRSSAPDMAAADALGKRAAEQALARGADSLLQAAP
jgi:hydroxymethylbilane synthase